MSDDNRSFGDRVKYYWHESLARHVTFRKGDRTALDLPLLVVIIAAIVAPWLAAGAVVVALIVGYEIRMRRDEEPAAEHAAASETATAATGAGATPPAAGQPAPETQQVPATPSASDLVAGSDVPPGAPDEPPAPQA